MLPFTRFYGVLAVLAEHGLKTQLNNCLLMNVVQGFPPLVYFESCDCSYQRNPSRYVCNSFIQH